MNYDPLTHLYELQYHTYCDDLHFYAKLAQDLNRVLELGSGTGRVSLHLARRGAKVTGLELSLEMLNRAREKATSENLALELIQGDMRSFELGRTFPLIIVPFNALMHLYTLPDQTKALERIYAHLEPGGTLAFDVYVPNFGLEGVLRHEGETFFDGDGSRTDVFVLQRIDRLKQMAYTQYFVDTADFDGRLERGFHTLEQRYFTHFELEWMLKCAGFEGVKIGGSFEGAPLDSSSYFMVVQAKKSSSAGD